MSSLTASWSFWRSKRGWHCKVSIAIHPASRPQDNFTPNPPIQQHLRGGLPKIIAQNERKGKCHCEPPKAAKQGRGEASLRPTTPRQGASPPGPPFAHPRGLRVRRCSKSHSWGGLNLWGDTPHDPLPGGSAPWTPVCPPPFRVRRCSGSHSGGLLQLVPSFEFVGGHPPRPPARGLRPLDPRLPTPVGLGFAGVLGPTRGVVANVGNSFPLLNLWGDTPHDPLPGGSAPWTPVCPPP